MNAIVKAGDDDAEVISFDDVIEPQKVVKSTKCRDLKTQRTFATSLPETALAILSVKGTFYSAKVKSISRK